LIGLLLLAPVLGAVIGGAAGVVGAKLSELGPDQLVVKDIMKTLEPPAERRCSRCRSWLTPTASFEALQPLAPSVIKTTLPDWDEGDLI
jgi:uncharacterized membrane protein